MFLHIFNVLKCKKKYDPGILIHLHSEFVLVRKLTRDKFKALYLTVHEKHISASLITTG